MKLFFTLLGFMTLSVAFCQSGVPLPPPNAPSDSGFTLIDRMPEFPGGIPALQQFLADNVKYPKAASRAGIEGRVFVAFVIGADGYIRNVHVAKGIGYGCDEECVRVVKLMPRWTPGRQSGKDVAVRYSVPISFSLPKKTKIKF